MEKQEVWERKLLLSGLDDVEEEDEKRENNVTYTAR